MFYCPACGAPLLHDDASYCGVCGVLIDRPPTLAKPDKRVSRAVFPTVAFGLLSLYGAALALVSRVLTLSTSVLRIGAYTTFFAAPLCLCFGVATCVFCGIGRKKGVWLAVVAAVLALLGGCLAFYCYAARILSR